MTHYDVEHLLGYGLLSLPVIAVAAAVIYYTVRMIRAIPAWIRSNEL